MTRNILSAIAILSTATLLVFNLSSCDNPFDVYSITIDPDAPDEVLPTNPDTIECPDGYIWGPLNVSENKKRCIRLHCKPDTYSCCDTTYAACLNSNFIVYCDVTGTQQGGYNCDDRTFNPDIDGACVLCRHECPKGQVYDLETSKCKDICPPDSIYNEEADRCEKPKTCPHGYSYNVTTGKCNKIHEVIECPPGTLYNDKTGKCDSIPAPPTCPPNSIYNEKTGKCEYIPAPPTLN